MFCADLIASTKDDYSFRGIRIVVYYFSIFLPLGLLLIDFFMSGLKFNYRIVVLNLFILFVYFLGTVFGELALDTPIYPMAEGDSTYPLYWKGFNSGKQAGRNMLFIGICVASIIASHFGVGYIANYKANKF